MPRDGQGHEQPAVGPLPQPVRHMLIHVFQCISILYSPDCTRFQSVELKAPFLRCLAESKHVWWPVGQNANDHSDQGDAEIGAGGVRDVMCHEQLRGIAVDHGDQGAKSDASKPFSGSKEV